MYRVDRSGLESAVTRLDPGWLEARDFSVPVQYGSEGLSLLRELELRPDLGPLGEYGNGDLWLGREIDETRRVRFVTKSGTRQFIRSRHVNRLGAIDSSGEYLDENRKDAPASADRVRIAWRDISRPSQRRRIHATILEAGPVTGNSVGIGYLKKGGRSELFALLGLVSSVAFEFQVRAGLMTNHVSAAALRTARVPRLTASQSDELAHAVAHCVRAKTQRAAAEVERLAADAYTLGLSERRALGRQLNLANHERSALLGSGVIA
jgi:Alw26I/Eco31I/Esp3I family type II restriction m6 adenine DNA methyltransferase